MLALYSTAFESHIVSEHATFHRVLEVDFDVICDEIIAL